MDVIIEYTDDTLADTLADKAYRLQFVSAGGRSQLTHLTALHGRRRHHWTSRLQPLRPSRSTARGRRHEPWGRPMVRLEILAVIRGVRPAANL